jgi:hypothetical protein
MQRLTLTPTLSCKRERGRAERFTGASKPLLPLAGEGGAKRRMRVSRGGLYGAQLRHAEYGI